MDDQSLIRHSLGFWVVNPLPSEAELSEYHASVYFQTQQGNYQLEYSEFEIEVQDLRNQRLIASASAFTARGSPGRILDVGSGEGYSLAAFHERGWTVKGIDFSLAGVEAKNPSMAPFVEQGDLFTLLDRLQHAGEQFDVIWAQHVLEHVLDPVKLMETLRLLLADDGVAVIIVPNDGNEWHETLFDEGLISRRWWIAPPGHLSYFTFKSFERLANFTGYVIVKMEGSFPIDWFLAHPGSNYVNKPELGPDAHAARLKLEHQIEQAGLREAGEFYSSLASLGLGRDVVAFVKAARTNGAVEAKN